jgi:hypothetical protein
MELYSGLDLHSTNTYIGILDTDFKRVFKKRVSNNLDLILETLQPFKDQLQGLVMQLLESLEKGIFLRLLNDGSLRDILRKLLKHAI